MALIDVVKWEANSHELISKFPSNDLRLGTQLVVYTGQSAYFVKGGKVLDVFDEPGTYTIKTENIPLLNKIINLPFGSDSPFQTEIWFVNHLAVLDSKWGTPTPIQLEDPKYEIIVPVRAFGQYGLRVSDPKVLIENLAGNMASFTIAKIESYFKGMMMSHFNNILSDKMNKDSISILNLNSHLNDISEFAEQTLQPEFNKYGIGLENFYIMSINVPEDDPSFIKLKEAKEQLAKLKLMGREFYQTDRSFGVMERAAENEGSMGSAIGIGMGMNAGMGMGGTDGRNGRSAVKHTGRTSTYATGSNLLCGRQRAATGAVRPQQCMRLHRPRTDKVRHTCLETGHACLGCHLLPTRVCRQIRQRSPTPSSAFLTIINNVI